MAGRSLGYVQVSSIDQHTARQVEAIGGVKGTSTDHVSGASRVMRMALVTTLHHA